MTGTSGTYRPVMNPAFDADVNFKPGGLQHVSSKKEDAGHYAPAAGWRRRWARGIPCEKPDASATAAMEKRSVRNRSVETSASACFTSTKVAPQISVTATRLPSTFQLAGRSTSSSPVGCASSVQVAEQQEQHQKNTFETQLAAVGMEPLLRRVRAAAMSAGANGDGRQAHGQRNVGVGGSAIQMRADAQVRIHRAHGLQDIGVVAEDVPPGRDPISLILAVTLPPVARSFSVSSARSTALVSSAAISSSLAGLSERMSTLVRASVGIELMLDPPSMMPKL